MIPPTADMTRNLTLCHGALQPTFLMHHKSYCRKSTDKLASLAQIASHLQSATINKQYICKCIRRIYFGTPISKSRINLTILGAQSSMSGSWNSIWPIFNANVPFRDPTTVYKIYTLIGFHKGQLFISTSEARRRPFYLYR